MNTATSATDAAPAPAGRGAPLRSEGCSVSWWKLAAPYVIGVLAFLAITFPFIWLKLDLRPTGEVFARWNPEGGYDFWRNMGPVCAVGVLFGVLIWLYDKYALQTLVDRAWAPVRPYAETSYAPFILPVLLIVYGISGQFNFLYAPSPSFLNLGIQVGIYMILAMGLNIVIGYTGLLVLGYAGFVGFGAYVFAIMQRPDMFPGTPWWAGIPVVFILGGVLGWLIGLPSIRLRGDYLAIETLGFAEGFRELALNLEIAGRSGGISLETASKLGVESAKAWIF